MMSPLQNHYSFIFVVVATTILATTLFTNTEACNRVLISYSSTVGRQLPPYVTNPKEQPYRLESTLIVLNNGRDEIKSWEVFVGFQHDEVLVSASNVVLSDGTTLPARVGNGTVFSGFPLTDLKTAIWTAGDLKQMQAQIRLVGTVFGVKPPDVPSPSSISLVNDGFICDKATAQGKNETNVCCIRDPNITTDEKFLTSQREISLSQTLKYEYF